MINLLPVDLKQEYRYARRNRMIVHWVTACVVAIIGVIAITWGGIFAIDNSINSYTDQVANAESQLASQNSTGVRKQVTDIANNLELMVRVLSQEILFSKLLDQLGAIVPSNAILTNLSIDQNQSAIDITAQTANYSAATQLQANLADPNNKIFSKADLVSITCSNGQQTTNTNYPCTVTIRALFTKNNPFLFINAATQKGSA